MNPTKLSFSTSIGTEEDGQLPGRLGNGRTDSQILNVVCGNRQLLFLISQGGYSVDCLTGIDYSASSIELSSQIARAKGIQGLRLEFDHPTSLWSLLFHTSHV
ncbi:hypothetical protein PGT21_025236 [Puccinia graminis f. sp. tritici]|uniref:Methyltransferase domain-containing protein n=1 Tax=Puccinia graminis f. sp. tritici TaxID=56615 RepID=A0A5B0QJG3_PUCGR|nr:hypothetical protein PGT21_025236 [Puccinia graminis f. sp. tritici]